MRNACLFAFLVLLSVAGCKGCSGESKKTKAAQPLVESRHARLLARLADRRLDPNQVFPKNDNGSVMCQANVDCFLHQVESCTRATFSNKQTIAAYGLSEVVNADYELLGEEAGRCKLTRSVRSAEVTMSPELIEALRKKGKTETDIAAMQSQAAGRLPSRHPRFVECWFNDDDALEVALDLADGKYLPRLWRSECREAEPPAGSAAAPTAPAEENPAPGATKPAAAPAAPAAEAPKGEAKDVPAPKQPQRDPGR